jgi:hypothetical protein
MAGITDGSHLQTHCIRMQADESLSLAGALARKGYYRGAYAALAHALPFSWRFPGWWWGAIKRIVRRAIPNAVVSAFRDWRRR